VAQEVEMRVLALLSALSLGCTRADDVDTETDAEDTDDTDLVVDTDHYVDAWGARYDCGGMDPADPAPLGKKIALTFDDGPSIETTPQILDVLRRHHVPATFFYVGRMADDPEVEDLVVEVAADPLFEIGNHTWGHQDLTQWDYDFAQGELESVNYVLEDFGVRPRFFRFPYGNGRCDIVDYAKELGMHVTGWHIDTADWCYAQEGGVCEAGYWRVPEGYEADMAALTVDQIVESDGGIVLFHDVWQYTADELEAIILELDAKGFVFTSLDDAEAFPLLNADDPHPFPWIGQACPVDADDCWQIENFSWCEPTDPDADPNAGACVLPCGDAPCFSRDGGPPSACVPWDGDAVCLGVSHELNGFCEGVPGTVPTEIEGVEVCVPSAWL
jgi:peptidoglycan/xylan/chitin deacetylase (PgdA/CDA1 family)